jgi:hypothetical protein
VLLLINTPFYWPRLLGTGHRASDRKVSELGRIESYAYRRNFRQCMSFSKSFFGWPSFWSPIPIYCTRLCSY